MVRCQVAPDTPHGSTMTVAGPGSKPRRGSARRPAYRACMGRARVDASCVTAGALRRAGVPAGVPRGGDGPRPPGRGARRPRRRAGPWLGGRVHVTRWRARRAASSLAVRVGVFGCAGNPLGRWALLGHSHSHASRRSRADVAWVFVLAPGVGAGWGRAAAFATPSSCAGRALNRARRGLPRECQHGRGGAGLPRGGSPCECGS